MDLPSWRVFLVSLSSDADPSNEAFRGRVEHVQTGRRAIFSCPDQLHAFLASVVDEDLRQERPAAPGEPDSP
ncbi:MAG: hypothetical protein MUC56_10220 [Thermoanaerobaculales bacterium]|nr:hypothetical protein [Thermoanaerobaculales bacterium]